MGTFWVKTRFNPDRIELTKEFEMDDGGFRDAFLTHVINLQEEGIRRALIELGWTPPEERNHEEHREP